MRQIPMSQAINEAIREEMRRQPDLILLGQDIGAYGGTFGIYRGLYEEFGQERVRDGPLCESATVGFAIGAAINGMRTIVELEFMDFVTVAMDQLVNQAAKMHYFFGGQIKIPMVVRTPIASRMGMGSQHSGSLDDARAWAESRHPFQCLRCQGTAEDCPARSEPGVVHRECAALR